MLMTAAKFAFKTMDEINGYLGGATIECLICGNHYQQLGNHIRYAHALNCAEYKEQFCIPRSRKLVSGKLHEKLSIASARMISARGTEWEESFQKKGAALSRLGLRKGQSVAMVPAVVEILRKNGIAGCVASHKKHGGAYGACTCPDCGASHIVSAFASFRKKGVLCHSCKQSRDRIRDRNRPNKGERARRQNDARALRLKNGEIISTLGQEIFDLVKEKGRPVKISEIRACLWPKHPNLKKSTFKSRISELLISGRLVAVGRGVYLSMHETETRV